MTPGQTIYHRATGEPWTVRSISDFNGAVYLRGPRGETRLFRPDEFRQRRKNCLSEEGRDGIRAGIAKRYAKPSRDSLVELYGEETVQHSENLRLPIELVAAEFGIQAKEAGG